MGLTPPPHLVPKDLEKSRAIPLLTLRACVAYKNGKTRPIYDVLLFVWTINCDLFPYSVVTYMCSHA